MATNVKLVRFVGGFLCGAAVSTGSCLVALKLYRFDVEEEEREITRPIIPEVLEQIGQFGLPVTGAEVRCYANHVLSYDQAKRTPRWVAEHLTNPKLLGKADRKRCRFRPDPAIPACFSAHNQDYLGSGWTRGHMAPAGDNKQSEQSMAETFYLSNIVPQNYENNAGFWNRLEIYCRELTKRYENVWVVSGPLVLPTEDNGKKVVSYQVIGKDDVAVPTHLFKAILVQNNNNKDINNNNSQSPSPILALGAFIVPNQPLGFDRSLTEFQVSLSELEKASGLTLFPKLPRPNMSPPRNTGKELDKMTDTQTGQELGRKVLGSSPEQCDVGLSPEDLCKVDGCKLMGFKEFTLYFSARRVASARSSVKLEQVMSALREQGIQPDDYLSNLYQQKKKELANREQPEGKTGA